MKNFYKTANVLLLNTAVFVKVNDFKFRPAKFAFKFIDRIHKCIDEASAFALYTAAFIQRII